MNSHINVTILVCTFQREPAATRVWDGDSIQLGMTHEAEVMRERHGCHRLVWRVLLGRLDNSPERGQPVAYEAAEAFAKCFAGVVPSAFLNMMMNAVADS